MLSSNKIGVIRNFDASLAQRRSHLRLICHGCQRAGVRPSMLATAGAAIVSRFMRVVLARGPVTDEDRQPGKSLCQSDDPQLSLHDTDLLVQRESELLSVRKGIFRDHRRIDGELGPYRWDNPMVDSLKEAIESSRQQRFTQQDYSHDSRSQIDNEVGGDDVLLECRKDPFQLSNKRLTP